MPESVHNKIVQMDPEATRRGSPEWLRLHPLAVSMVYDELPPEKKKFFNDMAKTWNAEGPSAEVQKK